MRTDAHATGPLSSNELLGKSPPTQKQSRSSTVFCSTPRLWSRSTVTSPVHSFAAPFIGFFLHMRKGTQSSFHARLGARRITKRKACRDSTAAAAGPTKGDAAVSAPRKKRKTSCEAVSVCESDSAPGCEHASVSSSLGRARRLRRNPIPLRCCVVLTHCPLYMYRDRRRHSSSTLLNIEEHNYLLTTLSTSSSADSSGLPFLGKLQAQLKNIAPAFPPGGDDAYQHIARRGMADASDAARVKALALSDDRRNLLEAAMRSDVVHQCLLSVLDSLVVSQLRTNTPHFSAKQAPTSGCGDDAADDGKEPEKGSGAAPHSKANCSLESESPEEPGNMETSPSSRETKSPGLNFDLLLHTMDGKLLRVSTSFRVPRSFKIFKKVFGMALSSPTGKLKSNSAGGSEQKESRRHGWASVEKKEDDSASAESDGLGEQDEGETLIEVLQPPFSRHLPQEYRYVVLRVASVCLYRISFGMPRLRRH